MSRIIDEMRAYLDCSEDALMHYGTPRHSGRYPWGSGENPYQSTRDFKGRVDELKKTGWKETPENVKKEFGLTWSQYRSELGASSALRRLDQVVQAESLRSDGLNTSQIAKKMGINESSVRSLFEEEREARMMQAMNVASFIEEQIKAKGPIDIGGEVNRELGVSTTKFDEAVRMLEDRGYVVKRGRVSQVGNGDLKTTTVVIGPADMPNNAAYDYANIHSLNEYASHDGGDTFDRYQYPASMDSKRLQIRYYEEGGVKMDGTIELRRGVPDLDLGNDHYSQVRILVDGDRYLKGMAVYADDLPDGVDVRFNTNKHLGTDMRDVLKSTEKNLKKDPENPFGSSISPKGQSYYDDPETGERKLSLINKRALEGDWDDWANKVPSQFLSKQNMPLIKRQLGLALEEKNREFQEIMALDNPTVKKVLLGKFADQADADSVSLSAAALPGQHYRVILPVNSLKDTEVYAPTYNNGDKIALVRYPHGGIFEIPILTVNNKNKEADGRIDKTSKDAVGINYKVAERLSGADFDGDTVMTIPVSTADGRVITKIKNSDPLKGLVGFDNKFEYGGTMKIGADGKEHWYRGGHEFKPMNEKLKQTQMGIVSNLITDMTLLGADESELERAVRHSMVVIDAAKHHLDYKASEVDNNIAGLKAKFQTGGASTIISRAKGKKDIPKTQGTPNINLKGKPWYDPSRPEGALIYKTADNLDYTEAKVYKKGAANGTVKVSSSGRRYISYDDNPDNWVPLEKSSMKKVNGKETKYEDGERVRASTTTKTRTQKSTQMAETDDAFTLVSKQRHEKEIEYANYANSLKSLANRARVALSNAGKVAFNANAKKVYAAEVKSLEDKINTARLNAPRERMSQIQARVEIDKAKKANPDITSEQLKKIGTRAVAKYRTENGSVKRSDRSIKITDREWEAIQSGAISESKLIQILDNTDIGELRARATPRTSTQVSDFKKSRIKSMQRSGRTTAEIADALGISTSTVSRALKEE